MKAVIIPAREGSTRLKNKMLLEICGKPLIRWTVENCLKVKNVKVIVATDSTKIRDAIKDLNIDVEITPSNLNSGSDRIAYVVKKRPEISTIVNVQGDEPLISPDDIQTILKKLEEDNVVSLYYPINSIQEYENPNVVKVVLDKNSYAIYFSRSRIPFSRDDNFSFLKKNSLINKHIGVYGYRRDVLLDFAYNLTPPPLEEAEKLEQLRLLYHGYRIKMIKASKNTIGVDTFEDYQKICNLLG